MPISSRFFVQSTTALLLVGFLALLGIVGMTFWLGERAQVYFNEVIAARDARGAAVDLRNALQTAESSQRGFLYTGNEVYLASYGPAKTLAERQLAAVNRLLASYGGASASVPRLTAVINEKFAEMDLTIAMKRDYQDADALAQIRTNRGKALMDEANVFFSGIISATDERLTTVVAEQKANAILLRLFSIISGIVIVIVIGIAAVTVVRYTRELRRARTEVSVLNAGLEQRVEARTADLQRANADIQRFVQIISHDLRAPLVSIVGFTAELEDSLASLRLLVDRSSAKSSADDPDLQEARAAATELLPEAIGYIRSSSDKMERLINAVLKLAREGRRPLKAETIDLREIVTAGAAAIQHQLSEAGGKIDIDLERTQDRERSFLAGPDHRQSARQRRQISRQGPPVAYQGAGAPDGRRPCRNRSCRQRSRHCGARPGTRLRSVQALGDAGPAGRRHRPRLCPCSRPQPRRRHQHGERTRPRHNFRLTMPRALATSENIAA